MGNTKMPKMKIKQSGKQFSCALSFFYFWGFHFLDKAVKSPKSETERKTETKVDAKQAVNRNESTSKLNFVHGCTHDLKQRAANKRMSRQNEAKSESHMREYARSPETGLKAWPEIPVPARSVPL